MWFIFIYISIVLHNKTLKQQTTLDGERPVLSEGE